jgi:hypothetical protein
MAFFLLGWTIIFLYFSNTLVAVQLLFFGEIQKATEVLNKQWLLNLPSVWGFAAADSYINTVENNKLFVNEQKYFLINNFRTPDLK